MKEDLKKAFDTINAAADKACEIHDAYEEYDEIAEIDEAQEKLSDVVILTKDEYNKLLEDQMLLNALMGAGVDNWEGWDIALENLTAEE